MYFLGKDGTYNGETLLVHLTGKLEVNTTEDGTHLSVNLHRAGDLGDDIDEMSSLERRIRLGRLGVAVLHNQAGSRYVL
jgi:hypothetical protein